MNQQSKAAAWEERKSHLHLGAVVLPDGRSISYHVDGDLVPGRPVILLLHGMMNSRAMFVMEARPSKCTFVVPDRPGYADSSDPGHAYSFTQFAHDMKALMDHLAVQEFGVIGHSSGGPNALAVAAVLGASRVKVVACLCGDTDYRHPSPLTPVDPVSKDVLCCCATPLRRCWPRCCVPIIMKCGLWVCLLMRRLALKCSAAFLKGMIQPPERQLWEEAGGDNFFQLALLESLRNGVRRGMRGMINDFALERMGRFDFDPSSIDCKVMFWSGELDEPCLQPTIFNHRVVCPASQIYIVPQRGHLGVLAPDTFWALVDHVLAAMANCGSNVV